MGHKWVPRRRGSPFYGISNSTINWKWGVYDSWSAPPASPLLFDAMVLEPNKPPSLELDLSSLDSPWPLDFVPPTQRHAAMPPPPSVDVALCYLAPIFVPLFAFMLIFLSVRAVIYFIEPACGLAALLCASYVGRLVPQHTVVGVSVLLLLLAFAPTAAAMEAGTFTGGGTAAVDFAVNLVATGTALAGARAAADTVVVREPKRVPKRGNSGTFGFPGRGNPRQSNTGIPSGVHFSAAAAPSRVAPTSPLLEPTSPLAPPPLRGSPSPAALDRMPQSPSSSPRPRPAKRVKEPWRSPASSAAPLRGSVSPRSIARCAPDSPGANLLSRFGLPGEGASAPPPRVAAAAPGALTGISGFLAQAPKAPAALGGAQHALVGAFGSAPAAAMQEGAQGSAAVQPLVPVAPPSLLRDALGNFLGPKANLGH